MQFKRLLTMMMAVGVLVVQIPARAGEVPQNTQAVEAAGAAQIENGEEPPVESEEETLEETEEETLEETEEETPEETEEETPEETEEETPEETEEETSEETEEETSEETEEETSEEIAEEIPEEEVSEKISQDADADTEDFEDGDEDVGDPDSEEDDAEDSEEESDGDTDGEEDDGEDEDPDSEDEEEDDEDPEYDPDAANPIGESDEEILHIYSHDEGGCEEDGYIPAQDGAFDYDKNGNGKIEKSESVSFANVFTSVRDEWLTSIGTYVKSPGSVAEFWIYLLNDNYKNPEDGTLIYDIAGEDAFKADEAGYQEFDLETPFKILKGQVFSIVSRIFGDKGGQLPIETATGESDKTFDVERGQSFYKDENGNWIDVCDLKVDPDQYEDDGVNCVGNVILRAITVHADSTDNDNLTYTGTDHVSNEEKSASDNSGDQVRKTDSDSSDSEDTESDSTVTKSASAKTADQAGIGSGIFMMLSGIIGLTTVLGKKKR